MLVWFHQMQYYGALLLGKNNSVIRRHIVHYIAAHMVYMWQLGRDV